MWKQKSVCHALREKELARNKCFPSSFFPKRKNNYTRDLQQEAGLGSPGEKTRFRHMPAKTSRDEKQREVRNKKTEIRSDSSGSRIPTPESGRCRVGTCPHHEDWIPARASPSSRRTVQEGVWKRERERENRRLWSHGRAGAAAERRLASALIALTCISNAAM